MAHVTAAASFGMLSCMGRLSRHFTTCLAAEVGVIMSGLLGDWAIFVSTNPKRMFVTPIPAPRSLRAIESR